MNKKTILQVFASRGWGGGEQYVYDLSKRLIEDGNTVIFSGKRDRKQEDKVFPNKMITLPFNGIWDLYSPFRLCRIVKKHEIDIVHIHKFKDAFTTLIAKFLLGGRLKVVLTRHLVKRAKGGFLYNSAYQSIDKIVFVSHLAKSKFLSTNPRVDSDKIVVIHNSILPIEDSLSKNHCDYRQKYDIPQSDSILLFTGGFAQGKGLSVLLEALAMLHHKEYKLLVAGGGKAVHEVELKSLTSYLHLQDKVIFLGFIENIADLIQQADIGIMPSLWVESFGLAALEFMRGGKPVITTNNGAQKEFINNTITGILVSPGEVLELANTIDYLLGNPDKMKEIGENAQLYFQNNLNYKMFFSRITEIYDSL